MKEEILGYDKNSYPIYECRRGTTQTAVCINCAICRKTIRGMGGPMFGSVCIECYDKSFRNDHE